MGKQGVPCARRLFEPYLVQIMSKLLERFGDVSAAVRAANDALARAVMANLSSQGAHGLRSPTYAHRRPRAAMNLASWAQA